MSDGDGFDPAHSYEPADRLIREAKESARTDLDALDLFSLAHDALSAAEAVATQEARRLAHRLETQGNVTSVERFGPAMLDSKTRKAADLAVARERLLSLKLNGKLDALATLLEADS